MRNSSVHPIDPKKFLSFGEVLGGGGGEGVSCPLETYIHGPIFGLT